jgi:hypothetical protein
VQSDEVEANASREASKVNKTAKNKAPKPIHSRIRYCGLLPTQPTSAFQYCKVDGKYIIKFRRDNSSKFGGQASYNRRLCQVLFL